MARPPGGGAKQVKRPYSGSMSTQPNMPKVPPFTTVQKAMPDCVDLSTAERESFSGSGYKPASPPGTPGSGIKPVGTKKGLPTG